MFQTQVLVRPSPAEYIGGITRCAGCTGAAKDYLEPPDVSFRCCRCGGGVPICRPCAAGAHEPAVAEAISSCRSCGMSVCSDPGCSTRCSDKYCEALLCTGCRGSPAECSGCLMPHCERTGDPDVDCLVACEGKAGCREEVCRLCEGGRCGCEACFAAVCDSCRHECGDCNTVSCPECLLLTQVREFCEGCNADRCLVCLLRRKPCDNCGHAVSLERLREGMASMTGSLEAWSTSSGLAKDKKDHGRSAATREDVALRWTAFVAAGTTTAAGAAAAARYPPSSLSPAGVAADRAAGVKSTFGGSGGQEERKESAVPGGEISRRGEDSGGGGCGIRSPSASAALVPIPAPAPAATARGVFASATSKAKQVFGGWTAQEPLPPPMQGGLSEIAQPKAAPVTAAAADVPQAAAASAPFEERVATGAAGHGGGGGVAIVAAAGGTGTASAAEAMGGGGRARHPPDLVWKYVEAYVHGEPFGLSGKVPTASIEEVKDIFAGWVDPGVVDLYYDSSEDIFQTLMQCHEAMEQAVINEHAAAAATASLGSTSSLLPPASSSAAAAAAAAAGPPGIEGWTMYTSASNDNRPYWHHGETGKTTWDNPFLNKPQHREQQQSPGSGPAAAGAPASDASAAAEEAAAAAQEQLGREGRELLADCRANGFDLDRLETWLSRSAPLVAAADAMDSTAGRTSYKGMFTEIEAIITGVRSSQEADRARTTMATVATPKADEGRVKREGGGGRAGVGVFSRGSSGGSLQPKSRAEQMKRSTSAGAAVAAGGGGGGGTGVSPEDELAVVRANEERKQPAKATRAAKFLAEVATTDKAEHEAKEAAKRRSKEDCEAQGVSRATSQERARAAAAAITGAAKAVEASKRARDREEREAAAGPLLSRVGVAILADLSVEDRLKKAIEGGNAVSVQAIHDEADQTPGARMKMIKTCQRWLNSRAGEEQKLQQVIQAAPAARDARAGAGAAAAAAAALAAQRPIQYEMYCPQTITPQLIGKQGATIKRLMRDSRAKLVVKQYGDARENDLIITGTPAAVATARRLVDEFYRSKGYDPTALRPPASSTAAALAAAAAATAGRAAVTRMAGAQPVQPSTSGGGLAGGAGAAAARGPVAVEDGAWGGELRQLLKVAVCEHHLDRFLRNQIDSDVLQMMDRDDFETMGVTEAEQGRILNALNGAGGGVSGVNADSDSDGLDPDHPDTCKICMDALVDILFLPCKHQCTCSPCGSSYVGKPCIICRTTVERAQKVIRMRR